MNVEASTSNASEERSCLSCGDGSEIVEGGGERFLAAELKGSTERVSCVLLTPLFIWKTVEVGIELLVVPY